jgi:serpin B
MMRHQEKVEYTYSDALQFEFIELKYKGGDYAMLLTLPRPGQTIKNLTEHFHLIDHREVNRNAKVVVVDYKIPKMKFSWEKSLVGPLRLSDVFRSADLSEMTTGKVPISEMIQATEMEVDEHGTIATAVTTIGMSRRLKPKSHPEVKFYVDRPFVVSIVHRPTNMLLFNGIVQKPLMA